MTSTGDAEIVAKLSCARVEPARNELAGYIFELNRVGVIDLFLLCRMAAQVLAAVLSIEHGFLNRRSATMLATSVGVIARPALQFFVLDRAIAVLAGLM